MIRDRLRVSLALRGSSSTTTFNNTNTNTNTTNQHYSEDDDDNHPNNAAAAGCYSSNNNNNNNHTRKDSVDVVITTYSYFSSEKADDRNFLRKFDWNYVSFLFLFFFTKFKKKCVRKIYILFFLGFVTLDLTVIGEYSSY